MYRKFSTADAEDILRSSEGRPTTFRGAETAHSGRVHLLLSNEEMLSRYEFESRKMTYSNGRWKQREFTLITAFSTFADMVEAATLVLNATQTQNALPDFFIKTTSEPGMRLEIAYVSPVPFRMRFAQGPTTVRTQPMNDLLMVLDRVDKRPFGLHVQTFFGTLAAIRRNSATLKMANGKLCWSYFVPLGS